MKNKHSVILVDDHELVRAGIRTLLNSMPSLNVIGECGDGNEAISILENECPDILVLDISLKGLNGIEVVKAVQRRKLPVKILMLSMHNNVEYVARCLKSGANGYLLKDAAVEELEPAVMAVLDGGSYVSNEIDAELLDRLLLEPRDCDSLLELLTGRQRQILQLIAEGYSTRQIAEAVNVSIKTVETHRAHIMSRLNIYDVAGLVRFAIQEQLIH
ncbi:response regulator transcription factor [Shewanella submarina]|uniref:Response regulator n=1 Tax=Shewanella submarina TaxID=2016376 RepID=A0ABV7GIQ1_9GAMM|nr:response regulator transcription factor [Shewanella submarina]MCL1035822.1 response regulator transcription factor [Shewanella submarina]